MLPRKYWGMLIKNIFETFFDFLTFDVLLIFVDFHWLFLNWTLILLIFHTCIHYEHTLFFIFSGTIWWTRSEQKVNEKWTKSQPKANFLWTKVTEKVNLDKNNVFSVPWCKINQNWLFRLEKYVNYKWSWQDQAPKNIRRIFFLEFYGF